MKEEEQIAKDYLEGLGIGNVIFEPDGNIPPDLVSEAQPAWKSGG